MKPLCQVTGFLSLTLSDALVPTTSFHGQLLEFQHGSVSDITEEPRAA